MPKVTGQTGLKMAVLVPYLGIVCGCVGDTWHLELGRDHMSNRKKILSLYKFLFRKTFLEVASVSLGDTLLN